MDDKETKDFMHRIWKVLQEDASGAVCEIELNSHILEVKIKSGISLALS